MRPLARVGIRELRQNLSVYLGRVRKGETLEVTEHRRPVALLTPLPEHADPIARLEAQGRIARRPTGRLEDLGPPLRLPLKMPSSRALDEEREERL